MSNHPECDAKMEDIGTGHWMVPLELGQKFESECLNLRREVEDLRARYRSAMMDRDSYRFQAEQKFAMRRELEELLGIDNGAPGDEQFKKGLKALKEVVRKAKLYDKKN